MQDNGAESGTTVHGSVGVFWQDIDADWTDPVWRGQFIAQLRANYVPTEGSDYERGRSDGLREALAAVEAVSKSPTLGLQKAAAAIAALIGGQE